MGILNSMNYKPTNVHFESQENGEIIHFILRRHPITNVPWILGYFLMLITPALAAWVFEIFEYDTFGFLPAEYQMVFLIVWYVLTMFFTFEAFLKWYFNVSIITSKRLIDVDFRGYWTKRISEASYDSVEDITYGTRKIWNIVFDYGSLLMQTAATISEFEFLDVPKPAYIHDKLTNFVEEFKKKGHVDG